MPPPFYACEMHDLGRSAGHSVLLEQSAVRARARRQIRHTRQSRLATGRASLSAFLRRLLGQADEQQREPQVLPTAHDPHLPPQLRAARTGAVGLPRRERGTARGGDGAAGLAVPTRGVHRYGPGVPSNGALCRSPCAHGSGEWAGLNEVRETEAVAQNPSPIRCRVASEYASWIEGLLEADQISLECSF